MRRCLVALFVTFAYLANSASGATPLEGAEAIKHHAEAVLAKPALGKQIRTETLAIKSEAEALIAQLTPVKEEPPKEEPGEPNLTAVGCFQNPLEATTRVEACGYPGWNDTGPSGTLEELTAPCVLIHGGGSGVEAGVYELLTCNEWQPHRKISSGETIEGKRIFGLVKIDETATHARLVNDEVVTDGWGADQAEGIENSGTGTVINHVTARGAGTNGTHVIQECLRSYGQGFSGSYDKFYNCDGIKLDSGGVLSHTFILDNAELAGEHYEPISMDCNVPSYSLTVTDSTLFNEHKQTAAVFAQNTWAPCHGVTLERNFLAGGGWPISLPGSGDAAPEVVIDNRIPFATCAEGTKFLSGNGEGNTICKEQNEVPIELESPLTPGGTGYFPAGGSYGWASHKLVAGSRAEGNFRDSNHETLPVEVE